MVGVDLGLSLTAILLLVPSAMPPRSKKPRDVEELSSQNEAIVGPRDLDALGVEQAAAVLEAMVMLGGTRRGAAKTSDAAPKLLIHNGLSSRLPRGRRG